MSDWIPLTGREPTQSERFAGLLLSNGKKKRQQIYQESPEESPIDRDRRWQRERTRWKYFCPIEVPDHDPPEFSPPPLPDYCDQMHKWDIDDVGNWRILFAGHPFISLSGAGPGGVVPAVQLNNGGLATFELILLVAKANRVEGFFDPEDDS